MWGLKGFHGVTVIKGDYGNKTELKIVLLSG